MIKKPNFENPHVIARLLLLGFFLGGMGLAYCWRETALLEKWLLVAVFFPFILLATYWRYLLPAGLAITAMIYYGNRLGKKALVVSGYGLIGVVWLFLLYLSFHISP